MAAAEADLAEREEQALASEAAPAELAALAGERDKLADEWDRLAEAHDEAAAERDVVALDRDLRASNRDVAARGRTTDTDEGFPDRYLSAVDRDAAAGNRADAHDDRAAAARGRARAADGRDRAAHDRETALERTAGLEDEITGLRRALETRNVIGQAQGVLIERYRMDADEAFRALVRLSQHTHVRLHEVARRLIRTTVTERCREARPPAERVRHP